jgi:23S rRNA-/tRNA-specific pseudouridylate synthase
LFPVRIIETTPHEVVLWKPPGLASELPRDPAAASVVTALRSEGIDGVRLVHRLDTPACGLMLVARTTEAAAYYSAEIAARRWDKVYVAAVACPSGRLQALLGDHKAYLTTQGRKAVAVRSGGKPSFLSVVHASPVGNGASGHAHVVIRLHTGRFHQIRVMMAVLGAPLVGDALYGGPAGAFYLEHLLLGARPFGADVKRVWRAPMDVERPAWSAELKDVVDRYTVNPQSSPSERRR